MQDQTVNRTCRGAMRRGVLTSLVMASLSLLTALSVGGRPATAQGAPGNPGYREFLRYPEPVAPLQEDFAAAVARDRTDPLPQLTPQELQLLSAQAKARQDEDFAVWQAKYGRAAASSLRSGKSGGSRVAGGRARLAATSTPSPAPDLEFDTIPFSQLFGISELADPTIAVSDAYVVSAANSILKIQTIDGSEISSVSLANFFGPGTTVPRPETTRNIREPRLSFDASLKRFILVAVGRSLPATTPAESSCVLAISQTSDPTGFWNKYVFSVGRPAATPTEFAHYPSLGYDSRAIYVTFEMGALPKGSTRYTSTSMPAAAKNRVMILSKFTAAFGGLAQPTFIDDIPMPAPFTGRVANTLKPVESAGDDRALGQEGLLVSVAGTTPAKGEGIALYKIDDPLSVTAPTVTSTFIDTADWDYPAGFINAQFSSVRAPDDALQKTVLRDGIIWTGHTVSTAPFFGRAEVRFYLIDPRGAGSLVDSEVLSDPILEYHRPAIMPDAGGNAVAVFQGASPTSFISMYHARYLGSLGTFEAPTLTEAGNAALSSFVTGDYTDASLDQESGGGKVWIQAQLPASNGFFFSSSWKLHAARIASGRVTVIYPNGDETLLISNPDPIKILWSRAGVPAVRIELSRDGGKTYTEVIADSTEDDGEYLWQVTEPFTFEGRIKISPVNRPNFGDTSDRDFTISDGVIKGPVAAAGQPAPIEDNFQDETDWVESLLFFPEDMIIRGLDVGVDITHSYIGDLEVQLVHPDGTSVMLHDETGEDQDNIKTNYPFPSTPTESLRKLFRKPTRIKDPVTGQDLPWKLRVRDLNPGNIGVLNGWTLTVFGPISGKFTLTSPNGNERWDIGSTQTITWTQVGVAGNVNIEVSRDGGVNWTTIISNTANDGSENWVVTGPVSDRAKVRVVSAVEPAINDATDRTFSIVNPFIKVLSPKDGDRLAVGKPFEVKWDAVPLSGTVSVEISRDGGPFVPVDAGAASTPNDGSYIWQSVTTPDTSAARIRVKSVVRGRDVEGISGAFAIRTISITPVSPNGADVLYTFTNQDIRWNELGVSGNVKLEISRDGGVTWETINPSTANDRIESFAVTGPPTTNALIRVTSVDDPTVVGVSQPFTIREMKVNVLAPQGGESWGVGTRQTIRWNTEGPQGVPSTVDILLSRDGGATFTPLFSGTPNDGTETYTVAGETTSNALIRIQASGFPAFGLSPKIFSIVPPGLQLITPNGGEELRIGQVQAITWNTAGLSATGEVKLEISRDGGTTWEPLVTESDTNKDGITANDGMENWTVSGETEGALIRITSLELPGASDTSNVSFQVVTPGITVLEPAGGRTWQVGSQQTIGWNALGVDGPVKIELTRNGGTSWETLFESTANDGQEVWRVTGPAGQNSRIRVSSVQDPSLSGESDGPFKIVQPGLALARPSGQRLLLGSNQTILWTTNGVAGNVDIEISRDNGESWDTIFENIANDGSEAWKVTGPVGDKILFRISSSNDGAIRDDSDSVSSIVAPTLRVTSPRGGTKWAEGSSQTITWEGGTVGTGLVEIHFSKDGKTFTPIIRDTTNDGSANWIVSGPVTKKAKLRVIWSVDPKVKGDSASFQITRRARAKN